MAVLSAGKYGQLGHGDNTSSDQPLRVEYLVAEGLRAEEVVCGPWTTYVCVLEPSKPPAPTTMAAGREEDTGKLCSSPSPLGEGARSPPGQDLARFSPQ